MSDEREDGEIVDDFEEISDFSIQSDDDHRLQHDNDNRYDDGKCDNDEFLRTMSLSSISGDSDDAGHVSKKSSQQRRRRRRRVRITNGMAASVITSTSATNTASTLHPRDDGLVYTVHVPAATAPTMKRKRRRHSDIMAGKRKRRRSTLEICRHESTLHVPPLMIEEQQATSPALSPMNVSESSSDSLDAEMQQRLRDAVRIERTTQQLHNKSLRSRIKFMIGGGEVTGHDGESDDSLDDDDLESLRTLALRSKIKSVESDDVNQNSMICDEKIVEKELMELRSEALKSAVLYKHEERKRRRELVPEQKKSNADSGNDGGDNKENSSDDVAKQQEVMDASVDEDVDIMRAMLLASVSRKITEKHHHAGHLSDATNAKNTTTITLPPVKPLIINLQDDSDTDDTDSERIESPEKPAVTDNSGIASSVDAFLKQQRAQFEAKEVERLQRELDKCSANIMYKKQMLERQPKRSSFTSSASTLSSAQRLATFHKSSANDKSRMSIKLAQADNSKIRLLSKSKQEEYLLLKSKISQLNQVQREQRLEKIAQMKQAPANRISNGGGSSKSTITASSKSTSLKAIISELQYRENGRLQIKGKYKQLGTVLNGMRLAHVKRNKCEQNLERALQQVSITKADFANAHREFTYLAQKLVQQKGLIDKRFSTVNIHAKPHEEPVVAPKITTEPPPSPTIMSSTTAAGSATIVAVAKPPPAQQQTNATTVVPNSIPILTQTMKRPSATPPNKHHTGRGNNISIEIPKPCSPGKKIKKAATVTKSKQQHIFATKCKKDIDKPLSKPTIAPAVANITESVGNYVSPLGAHRATDMAANATKTVASNPNGTLCPYELFGSCKDAQCGFVHCGRAS